ncbi:MAG: FAD-binding oxidoreductase [Roseiflexaceae bacterium]
MKIPAHSAADVGRILAEASAEDRPVVPFGAGQHQYLLGQLPEDAWQLDLQGLDQVGEYTPADLTITVGAGARLADIQQLLRAQRQWLPWDPAGQEQATIGGLLASARSGPLRLGYGTPRDWLLGAAVALGDGRIVKSGGRVVKNVAGYDSHKLQIGAFGTLGVLLEVTFKIAPLPEAAASAMLHTNDLQHALQLAEQLRARPLNPASLIISRTTGQQASILVRYLGVSAAVERQITQATSLGGSIVADSITWQAASAFSHPNPTGILLRVGCKPAALPDLIRAIEQHGPAEQSIQILPGVGLAYLHWPMLTDLVVRLRRLREAIAPAAGYVVVEHAPLLVEGTDRWGPLPETIDLMRRLRAAWDPAGILNRGRYLL